LRAGCTAHILELQNISKLTQSDIEDGLKFMVETISEKVTTSKIATKTVLNTILKKGGSMLRTITKFVTDTIIIGGEIMGIYKLVEEVTGPLDMDEKAAIVIFISEVTDITEGDETIKLTKEQAVQEWNNMSDNERQTFIDSLPPKLLNDTITAIHNRMKDVIPRDIDAVCPQDILMDTTYWKPNTKFIGSDEVFEKYPGCKSYVKP
jgi:hypothetical protein